MWFHSRIEKSPWYPIGNDKEKIFFPTLKFQNEKHMNLKHKFSAKKVETYYWMRYPHTLYHKKNAKMTIYCFFDFSTFPFDSHECNLTYGMNSYVESDISMMPTTVQSKTKQAVMGEPPLLCTYYVLGYQMNILIVRNKRKHIVQNLK